MSNQNMEVRLLLILWGLSQKDGSAKIADLSKRFGKTSKEFRSALGAMQEKGAIVLAKEKRTEKATLTPLGATLLTAGLTEGFVFSGTIVSSHIANTTLAWFRKNAGQPKPQAQIDSYEAFAPVFLDVYDRLNADYKYDHLVPIYRIRREIGDRVTRANFDTWVIQMQAKGIVELLSSDIEDAAPDKLQDSISTPVSGLRCFATKKIR